MNQVNRTGGARVGWVNATWPLANLSANVDRLELDVIFIGKYEFHKGQIVQINMHGFIPVLASGVKIEHNVENYPKSIIFWTLGSPKKLIREIENTGLLSGVPKKEDVAGYEDKGLPVKIVPLMLAVLIWNVFFIIDQSMASGQPFGKPGLFSVFALVLVFITSLAIKNNPSVASFFLRPGRLVSEILPVLNLLILVSGTMSIIFTFMFVLDVF
jgi:hypothetical protein